MSRSNWSAQDDDKLRKLVQQHGNEWTKIASYFPSKNAKQCRRHWTNVLGIQASREGWSAEEDDELARLHLELGNRWAEIARRFGDRTDNACKNRWGVLCKKRPELARQKAPDVVIGVRLGTGARRGRSARAARTATTDSDEDEDEDEEEPEGNDGDDDAAEEEDDAEEELPAAAPPPRKRQRLAAQPARAQAAAAAAAAGIGSQELIYTAPRGGAGMFAPSPFDLPAAGDALPVGWVPISISVGANVLSPAEVKVAKQVNSLKLPIAINLSGELQPPAPQPGGAPPGARRRSDPARRARRSSELAGAGASAGGLAQLYTVEDLVALLQPQTSAPEVRLSSGSRLSRGASLRGSNTSGPGGSSSGLGSSSSLGSQQRQLVTKLLGQAMKHRLSSHDGDKAATAAAGGGGGGSGGRALQRRNSPRKPMSPKKSAVNDAAGAGSELGFDILASGSGAPGSRRLTRSLSGTARVAGAGSGARPPAPHISPFPLGVELQTSLNDEDLKWIWSTLGLLP